jgi:biopolymer transport protein ExbD
VQFRRRGRPSVAINLAPLIDVVFLLVIFFAVSTTFLDTAGLELELPSSESTATREPREIAVVLAADGAVSFDGEPVTLEDLAPRLRGRLAESDRKQVVLRADTDARHGDVVRVMDAIRAAGAEAMTVAARRPQDG